MLIALDYDGTYTRDPKEWDRFIKRMQFHAGHGVCCVTMRRPDEPISMSCPVYYTSRRAKRPHMEALGIHVDVWIDDRPDFIERDAKEQTDAE